MTRSRLGRNDPCPCGSGKKYKKCCLRSEPDGEPRAAPEATASMTAFTWMHEHLGDAARRDFEEMLHGFEKEALDRLERLPEDLYESVSLYFDEWFFCDGLFEGPRGRAVTYASRILGPGGPSFSEEERDFLVRLAATPLRLYRVEAVQPRRGLELRDIVAEGSESFWLPEPELSRSAKKGFLFGLRLLEGDVPVVGSTLLPFPPEFPLEALLDLCRWHEEKSDGQEARRRVGLEIFEWWLACLLGVMPPALNVPEDLERDWTLDVLQVDDVDALAEALDEHPEINGEAESGWTLLEEEVPEFPTSFFLGERADEIKAVSSSGEQANVAESWLRDLAGGGVARRERTKITWDDVAEMLDEPSEILADGDAI